MTQIWHSLLTYCYIYTPSSHGLLLSSSVSRPQGTVTIVQSIQLRLLYNCKLLSDMSLPGVSWLAVWCYRTIGFLGKSRHLQVCFGQRWPLTFTQATFDMLSHKPTSQYLETSTRTTLQSTHKPLTNKMYQFGAHMQHNIAIFEPARSSVHFNRNSARTLPSAHTMSCRIYHFDQCIPFKPVPVVPVEATY